MAIPDLSHFTTRSTVRPAIRFRWILLISCAFVGLAAVTNRCDIALVQRVQPSVLRGDFRRVLKLSEFFAHGFSVVVVAWATWVLAPHLRRHLLRLVMCVVWPPLIVHAIKVIVVRMRPTSYLDHHLVPHLPKSINQTWQGMVWGDWNVLYQSQSFPSAHAAMVCGFAIGMCWLYPKGKYLFWGIACLACLQRVAFLAHWPSDVLTSVAIAFLISGGLIQNWGLGYLMGRFEKETVS